MARLPAIDREQMSPDAQKIFDRILAGRSSAAARGPTAALMHVPTLADRVFTLEDYFRGPEVELPPADRELVILAVAREAGAKFAWARHEARANEAGVNQQAIEALRTQGSTSGLAPREQLLIEVTQTLLRTWDVPQALYERALKELGQRQLIETIVLIGNYVLIGSVIKTFDIQESAPTF
jgi:4-carboxymuconolactone decarboxylase